MTTTTGPSILAMRGASNRLIWYAATAYDGKPHGPLFELGDNSKDSGAHNLWVEVAPEGLRSTDDGWGMNCYMDPESRGLLELYLDDIDAGKANPADDPRDIVPKHAQRTLEWMVRAIGLSSKAKGKASVEEHDGKEERRSTHGRKGIGALSTRSIAGKVRFTSFPSVETARGNPRVLNTLIPPDDVELDEGQALCRFEQEDGVLLDPYGNVLESGTVVTLTDIRPGLMEREFQPHELVEALRGRYGQAIRDGVIKIIVIDKITDEGRRTPGGISIPVTPTSHFGIQLVDEIFFPRGGEYPFRVVLHYAPFWNRQEKRPTVSFNVEGSPVRSMRELSGFESHPLLKDLGVNGFVEWPKGLPDDKAPLNTGKDSPLPSAYQARWKQAVERAFDQARAKIDEIEQREHDAQMHALSEKLAEATLSALSEVPLLAHVKIGRGAVSKSTERRPRVFSGLDSDRTICYVRDEHRQPVAGVTIHLTDFSGKTVLAKRVTGVSGQTSFEALEDGQYQFVITGLPPGASAGAVAQRFRISRDHIRHTSTFDVISGKEPPLPKHLPGLRIWSHAFVDPGQPYSTDRLEAGVLEVNSEWKPLSEAVRLHDAVATNSLLMNLIATGIAEYGYKEGDPQKMIQAQCQLYAVVSRLYLGLRKGRKK